MANAYYDYYISNQDLLQECDKEENMAVTGASVTYCLKRRLYNALSSVTVFAHSPPGRCPDDKYPVNTSHRSRFVEKYVTRSIIF